MFSKSCKYGIRAVLYLALHSDDEKNKIGVKKIAEKLHVPSHFLAKILQELSRKNLVSSTKGPNGGFFLTRNNKQESLLKVIESIDGLSYFEECAFGLKKCDNEHPCPIHHLILPLRSNILDELQNKSVAEFAYLLAEGKTHLTSF